MYCFQNFISQYTKLTQFSVGKTNTVFSRISKNQKRCSHGPFLSTKVCSFGISTLYLQKKREKLLWECLFCTVKFVKEINIEGIKTLLLSPMLDILSQTEIMLNWLPVMPFLIYMHGTRLTFGKPFV